MDVDLKVIPEEGKEGEEENPEAELEEAPEAESEDE